MHREFFATDPQHVSELDGFYGLKTFKGADVVTTQEALIDHPRAQMGFSGLVKVRITPQNLPHLPYVSRDAAELTNTSAKSRLAQLFGLDIGSSSGRVIFPIPDHEYNEMDLTKPFEAQVAVSTFAARPAFFEAGTPLYRYMHTSERNRIQGERLFNLLDGGILRIGEDSRTSDQWHWAINGPRGIKDIAGVFVKVNRERRFWLPPHPENRPLSMPNGIKDYRVFIDQHLEPVPQDGAERLWIGETPHITLPRNVNAMLDFQSYRVSHQKMVADRSWGYHINSRLLDAGSDWPIRVEIVSPCDGADEYVLVHLYENLPALRPTA